MSSFNRVMLLGNLTRDPQIKKLQGGTTVAEFGFAVNRKFRTQAGEDREEVTFVDCSAFGKQAETLGQYAKKGKPLFIEGRLKYDSWDDKTSGAKRSKLSVVVENFQFVGAREGESSAGGGTPASQTRQRQPVGAGAKRDGPFGEAANDDVFKEADVPF